MYLRFFLANNALLARSHRLQGHQAAPRVRLDTLLVAQEARAVRNVMVDILQIYLERALAPNVLQDLTVLLHHHRVFCAHQERFPAKKVQIQAKRAFLVAVERFRVLLARVVAPFANQDFIARLVPCRVNCAHLGLLLHSKIPPFALRALLVIFRQHLEAYHALLVLLVPLQAI